MADDLSPNNVDAEKAVLGSLIIDKDAILFVREVLTPNDFYIERHAWIYEAITTLTDSNQPPDLITLTDELDRRKKLTQAGGTSYLTSLMNVTPSAIHAEYYAQIVKRDSVLRQLLNAAGKVAKIAHTSDIGPEDALQQASDAVLNVSTSNMVHKPQPVKLYASRVLDEIEAAQNGQNDGLYTGLKTLDRWLGGLKPGKFYLLAGRPAMGKSSLGLQMAITNAKLAQKNVLYFSCEMTGEELTMRMVSGEAKIDGAKIQNGTMDDTEWSNFYEALNYVSNWPIYIDDRTRTIEGIKARSILQSAHGLDMIVVDYIQRVQVGKNYQNRDSEIGAVSNALKSLSMDLKIPVVAISSLNRKCEERNNKRPYLADLRESGNLEYDADIVLFIYRDEVYDPETTYPNLAEISIAKHRGGKLGTTQVYFKKQLTQFVDLEIKKTELA